MVVHIDYTRGLRYYHGSLFFNTAYATRRERALQERGWRRRQFWHFEVQRALRIGHRLRSWQHLAEVEERLAGLQELEKR